MLRSERARTTNVWLLDCYIATIFQVSRGCFEQLERREEVEEEENRKIVKPNQVVGNETRVGCPSRMFLRKPYQHVSNMNHGPITIASSPLLQNV